MQNNIVKVARSYKDVKWRHQGRSERGLDCAGLLLAVGWKLGYVSPEENPVDYDRKLKKGYLYEHFDALFDRKMSSEIKDGDIIVFKDANYPCHCGIIAHVGKKMTFIHSFADKRKVVESVLTDKWLDQLSRLYTYRQGKM
jgi:hypothetical protein